MPDKSHNILFIVFASFLLLISSCHTEKVNLNSEVSQRFSSPQKQLTALTETYKDWNELNVPLSVEFSAPMKLSASGRAYMKKGEWIYVSMRFLGIEMVNLYVTRDSVFATDKINKVYVTESLRELFQGFTIDNVQELLLGRLISAGNAHFDQSAYKITDNRDKSILTSKKTIMGAHYGYVLDKDRMLPASFFVAYNSRDFQCDFSDGFKSPFGLVARNEKINFVYGKEQLNVNLSWAFEKAKWNTKNDITWKKPSGYKRLDIKSLAKILDN